MLSFLFGEFRCDLAEACLELGLVDEVAGGDSSAAGAHEALVGVGVVDAEAGVALGLGAPDVAVFLVGGKAHPGEALDEELAAGDAV